MTDFLWPSFFFLPKEKRKRKKKKEKQKIKGRQLTIYISEQVEGYTQYTIKIV